MLLYNPVRFTTNGDVMKFFLMNAVIALSVATSLYSKDLQPNILDYPLIDHVGFASSEPIDDHAFQKKVGQLLTRLEKHEDVLWIGYPWSRVVTSHDNDKAYAYYNFVAKDKAGMKRLRVALNELGLTELYSVPAESVYVSPWVMILDQNDMAAQCEITPNVEFESWVVAYQKSKAEAEVLIEQPIAAILDYVHRDLNCDTSQINLAKIKEVNMFLNMSNRSDCPLDGSGLHSCFITAGLFKEIAYYKP
jgi:hypothetical protein